MSTITINRRSANITVKATSGVFTQVNGIGGGVTLNNQGASIGGIGRLDGLSDVVESTPSNNATLVYHSQDDKYYVEEINLDGGNF